MGINLLQFIQVMISVNFPRSTNFIVTNIIIIIIIIITITLIIITIIIIIIIISISTIILLVPYY